MNFLRGAVGTAGDTTLIRGESWELPLSPANAARARASTTGEVIIGARHTNLTVLPESATTGMPARIYTVEPTGDLTFVHVGLGNQVLIASAPGTYRGKADQPIRLDFDQERLYLFDGATEQAL
jgi:multiple sugar transport system ATP-binding protein